MAHQGNPSEDNDMQVTSHSLLEMTPVIPVVQITDAEQAVPIALALRKAVSPC